VVPPSRELKRPASVPCAPSELSEPVPASSTCAFWGSKSSALIDSDGGKSVSGVQVGLAALALAVRQMPPLTVPANSVSELVGCGSTTCTAPEMALPGARLVTAPCSTGPPPCASHLTAPSDNASVVVPVGS